MHLDAAGVRVSPVLEPAALCYFFWVSQPNREPRAPMPLSWEREKNTPGSWSTTPALRYAVAVKLIEPTARAHHQRHPFKFRLSSMWAGEVGKPAAHGMDWIGVAASPPGRQGLI